MKKFQIIKSNIQFVNTTSKSELINLIEKATPSDLIKKVNNSPIVIIDSNAATNIFNHIGWGENIKVNQIEQGGYLIGKVKKIPNNQIVVEVNFSIPGMTEGSIKHLSFTHKTWELMYEEFDKFSESDNELLIVGWYHTHPRYLKVYMSDIDKKMQKNFFYRDWQVAVIFNPQKKIWRVFYGMNSEECLGYILN